jgi:hypothetical protein
MMSNQKSVREYEQPKFDDNTRSTIDQDSTFYNFKQIVIENLKTNISSKQELGATSRYEVPSSRQFTNRLNTL